MNLEYGGTPDQWIARDGLPASILGGPKDRIGGLPSAEDDDGFVVFEFLLPAYRGGFGSVWLFPRSYGGTVRAFGGGLVPLHHQPTQRWAYRPAIYRWNRNRSWERQGSQQELDWRYSLHKMYEAIEEGPAALDAFMDEDPLGQANQRAEELLDSMLGPTQKAEMVLRGDSFRVIGGATGHHYMIDMGNGFARVDPLTNEPMVNYCSHPEDWMPHADVALAHKLNLETPELEEAILAGANAYERQPRLAAPEKVRDFRYATDMEREFLIAS